MTPDPLDWLLHLEHLGMKFGLDNMVRLTGALDHPERSFASIHVAGTNGKGSVTAMLETALRSAGYRSARYTSPHLERLEERFVVAGSEVATNTLRDVVAAVRDAVQRLERAQPFSPTFFECATAAAFELFRRERVQIAVLEVGLGGRLDATNVVQPIATAITSIDFDHQALLGNTLEEIAAEKAGIIKPGVPVVVGPLAPAADAVISSIAAEQAAPLVRAPRTISLEGLTPALRGRHQRDNIAVTVALVETIRRDGIDVQEPAVRAGIEEVKWPGRLEHLSGADVKFLLDAAHNVAGARALAAYLREIGWTDAVLVFGAMRDKDIAGMLAHLVPVSSALVCTTAPSPRAETAEGLAAAATAAGGATVHAMADPVAALSLARSLSSRVVIAGSIFLIGALRGILR